MKWCQLPSASHPFRDEAFTRADWDRHVTWRRFLPDGLALPIVIATLSPVILWSVLVSLALGLYATYAEPEGWPQVSNHPDLIVPFNLTSFALSLLMLYKTNSSYARWWEARTQLGQLYINVRSVMRMASSWLGPKEPQLVRAVHCWITAVMPSLCAYLRENPHYYRHLEGVLTEEELEWLSVRGIPPVAALQTISELLATAESLSDIQRSSIETVLNSCDTVVGACERIQRQAMPLAYNRHTHRFLFVYLTFLPVALWPLYEWFTLPIMAVLTLLLVGLENIGIQIEEPFRVLPLDQMCAAARRATTFMLNDMLSVRSMAASSAATRLQPAGKQQQGGADAGQQAAGKQAAAELQEAVWQQAEQLGNGEAANLAPAGPAGPAAGPAALPAVGSAGALGGDSFRRAAPFQFTQMSVLPEGWDRGNELPVTELLGLAAGRPPRRSSLDGQRPPRGGGTASGSSDGGGSGQGSPRHGPRRRSFERQSRLAAGAPAAALPAAAVPAAPAGGNGSGGELAGAHQRNAGPREDPDVEQALQQQGGRLGDSGSSSVAARLLGGAAGTAGSAAQAAGTPGEQQGAQGRAQAAERDSGWEPVPYPEARWHGDV